MINFCGKDEIVVAQTADCMSGQFDSQVSVASKVKIRMVSFGLCEVPNLYSSLHHVCKVFKLDGTGHPFSVFGDIPEGSGIP